MGIFKAYDIRGVYPTELDEEMARKIGRAYAVKNFGRKEMTSSIVVSYYWHFVDVVWIALFLVIYFLK